MLATQDLRDVWERHNGAIVVVGGLRCRLRVESYEAIYPYVHTVFKVSAVPTGSARRTATYQRTRAELGDDWDTDVLESDYSVEAEILAQLT